MKPRIRSDHHGSSYSDPHLIGTCDLPRGKPEIPKFKITEFLSLDQCDCVSILLEYVTPVLSRNETTSLTNSIFLIMYFLLSFVFYYYYVNPYSSPLPHSPFNACTRLSFFALALAGACESSTAQNSSLREGAVIQTTTNRTTKRQTTKTQTKPDNE